MDNESNPTDPFRIIVGLLLNLQFDQAREVYIEFHIPEKREMRDFLVHLNICRVWNCFSTNDVVRANRIFNEKVKKFRKNYPKPWPFNTFGNMPIQLNELSKELKEQSFTTLQKLYSIEKLFQNRSVVIQASTNEVFRTQTQRVRSSVKEASTQTSAKKKRKRTPEPPQTITIADGETAEPELLIGQSASKRRKITKKKKKEKESEEMQESLDNQFMSLFKSPLTESMVLATRIPNINETYMKKFKKGSKKRVKEFKAKALYTSRVRQHQGNLLSLESVWHLLNQMEEDERMDTLKGLKNIYHVFCGFALCTAIRLMVNEKKLDEKVLLTQFRSMPEEVLEKAWKSVQMWKLKLPDRKHAYFYLQYFDVFRRVVKYRKKHAILNDTVDPEHYFWVFVHPSMFPIFSNRIMVSKWADYVINKIQDFNWSEVVLKDFLPKSEQRKKFEEMQKLQKEKKQAMKKLKTMRKKQAKKDKKKKEIVEKRPSTAPSSKYQPPPLLSLDFPIDISTFVPFIPVPRTKLNFSYELPKNMNVPKSVEKKKVSPEKRKEKEKPIPVPDIVAPVSVPVPVPEVISLDTEEEVVVEKEMETEIGTKKKPEVAIPGLVPKVDDFGFLENINRDSFLQPGMVPEPPKK